MFITLEGIEGSGKTTLIRDLKSYLQSMGHEVVMTREPGGSQIGAQIRAILLDSKNKGLHAMAELLLYMADRAQHLKEIVKPNLSAGRIVLCDRYFDATLAYQGYARGLDIGLISQLHRTALEDFKPDITYLLDLDPKTGLKRAWKQIDNGQRVGAETRFEEETLDFHGRVRKGYLALADLDKKRFKIIDASRPKEHVVQEIISHLDKMIMESSKP